MKVDINPFHNVSTKFVYYLVAQTVHFIDVFAKPAFREVPVKLLESKKTSVSKPAFREVSVKGSLVVFQIKFSCPHKVLVSAKLKLGF